MDLELQIQGGGSLLIQGSASALLIESDPEGLSVPPLRVLSVRVRGVDVRKSRVVEP